MTNFENEEPQIEQFTDSHDSEPYTREYLKAAIDLVDKVGELAGALRSDRMADMSQYNFMFDGVKLAKMYLPDTIQAAQALYGQLDELVIRIEQDGGSPTSSISFSLHFLDEENKLTLIKVDRPGHYKQTSKGSGDHMYELGKQSKYREISSIPRHDLNRMIASLMFPPNEGDDFSVLDKLDLNDSTIYEALVAALQKHTTHYVGQEYYELHSKPGSFIYAIDDGELVSAEITQMKFSDIIMDDGLPKSVSKSIATDVDLSDGLTLMFTTVEELGKDIERKKFSPELTDYAIASEFMDYHIQLSNPIQTERLNELTLPSRRALPGEELD